MSTGSEDDLSKSLGSGGWGLVILATGAGIVFSQTSFFLALEAASFGGRHWSLLYPFTPVCVLYYLIRLRVIPDSLRYGLFLLFLVSASSSLFLLCEALFGMSGWAAAFASSAVTLVVIAPIAWRRYCLD